MLAEVVAAIGDVRAIEFITHLTEHDDRGFVIHQFGGRLANPFAFPDALIYTLSGFVALLRRQRRRKYAVLVSQDALYTGVFTGIVARLTGARFVVMDHGSALVAFDRGFQATKLAVPLPVAPPGADILTRLHVRSASLRRRSYFATLGIVVRAVERLRPDYLLVGEEEVTLFTRRLGVAPSRISRYDYTVDVETFAPLEAAAREERRAALGIASTTVAITLVNRLTPEKGLKDALPAVARAMKASGVDCTLTIAGDGELRPGLERLVAEHGIADRTRFPGALGRDQIAVLLGSSDIFIYSGTIGSNQSVAILEAMASGCAVIATPAPVSNRTLLADGRGRVVELGDLVGLESAVRDAIRSAPWRAAAGSAARDFVQRNHTTAALRGRLLDVLGR